MRTRAPSPPSEPAGTARAAAPEAPAASAPAAVAAAVAAALAAAPVAAATALLAGPRLVHLEIALQVALAVERLDRLRGRLLVGHLDEREAARAPGLLVHHHVHVGHLAVRLEQRAHVVLGDL